MKVVYIPKADTKENPEKEKKENPKNGKSFKATLKSIFKTIIIIIVFITGLVFHIKRIILKFLN